MADTPSLGPASGFQDCIAKRTQNQGQCYQIGWFAFDQEDGLHEPPSANEKPTPVISRFNYDIAFNFALYDAGVGIDYGLENSWTEPQN
jgi:hypothetical protein